MPLSTFGLRQFQKKIIPESKPQEATIVSVDGNHADILLPGSSNIIHYVQIDGDPNVLEEGQTVFIEWRKTEDGTRPIVSSTTNAQSISSGGTSVQVTADNETIENSENGLRVKAGSLQLGHLSFVPALEGHIHADSLTANGWQITPDGSIFSGNTFIHASGQISLGSGEDVIKLDSLNSLYRIWAGAIDPTLAPFSVTKGGVLRATGAYIEGDLQSTDFLAGYYGWQLNKEGDAEFNNVTVRGAIKASVFEKTSISTVGGSLLILAGDVLASDMTAADNSHLITGGQTTFPDGAVLRIKDGTDDEWLTVVSHTGNDYTVTRDRDGAYAADTNPAWKAGTAVVSYGVSGSGGILLTSETDSPFIDIFDHTGTPWDGVTLKTRLGNLDGITDLVLNPTGYGLYSDNAYLKGSLVTSNGVTINDDGITIEGLTAKYATRAYRMMVDGNIVGTLSGWDSGGVGSSAVYLETEKVGTQSSYLYLQATADYTAYAYTKMSAIKYIDDMTREEAAVTLQIGPSGSYLWLDAGEVSTPNLKVGASAIVPTTGQLLVVDYATVFNGVSIGVNEDPGDPSLILSELPSAPAAPSSGGVRMYAKDNNMFVKGDDGLMSAMHGRSMGMAMALHFYGLRWFGNGGCLLNSTLTPIDADLSPRGLHMSMVGGPGALEWNSLHITLGYLLNGSSQYSSIANTSIGGENWFNIGGWFYLSSVGRDHGLWTHGSTQLSHAGLINSGNQTYFEMYTTGGVYRSRSGPTISGTGWHFIVLRFGWDAGSYDIKWFVDGSWSANVSDPAGACRAATGNFYWGMQSSSPRYLAGGLGERFAAGWIRTHEIETFYRVTKPFYRID